MKKLITLILVVELCTSVFTGCKSSSGGSKEVNIICWTEYIPQETFDNFEKETGVKVNVTYYSSADEMLAKVTTSAKDTYDVIMCGTSHYTPFLKDGIIEEIDKSKLTNIGNISDEFLKSESDPEGKYGIPYMGANAVIAVNTDVIKDEITSYQDLLNPAYKDSIVVIDDARAVVGMASMAQGYDINDTSDESLAAASQYLEELKPNIHAYISTVFPYFNPNSAAIEFLDESFLSNPIKNMPEEERTKIVYMKDIGDDMTKIVDIWNNLKE